MVKVITYGTYDLLHFGHIRLLERAKALGDYLIVGVTAEDFDKTRGKINVQQSLMERVEAVRATGIADEIIIEEYEGQKIDDIRRYGVDIFTVGSDWVGKFDYLKEYCKVVYLDRTKGVSSTQLRAEKRSLKLGMAGDADIFKKYLKECSYVNGIECTSVFVDKGDFEAQDGVTVVQEYSELLKDVDAVYVVSHPRDHYFQIRQALMQGKHVLCEAPIALSRQACEELFALAHEKNLILMEAVKTAYSTAYYRLLLLAKSGRVGKIVSVDATCTSLRDLQDGDNFLLDKKRNTICAWGPTALLPVFQILGTGYCAKTMHTCYLDREKHFDLFTKIDFQYRNAVASIKIGKGVKSEGELIISGTKGYIYVPAPWWKTDYFELRFENPEENKRYFYQLDGEGIRYELVAFTKSIETGSLNSYIEQSVSEHMAGIMEDFMAERDMNIISLE